MALKSVLDTSIVLKSNGDGENIDDYPEMEDKYEKTRSVIRETITVCENPAVLWTGGKDSTLLLYFILEVVEELEVERPPIVFIDHGQHFTTVEEFVKKWSEEWNLDVIYASNDDLLAKSVEPGDEMNVSELSDANKYEVREKLEFKKESFSFGLDSEVGNHLLKTVALNDVLKSYEFDAVFSGIRWDEQDARADETFVSPRLDTDKYPPHYRIHPILQYSEQDVWTAMWSYVVPETVNVSMNRRMPSSKEDLPESISVSDIPVCELYFEGFRSLGSESGTVKSSTVPAWEQDIENTIEREGRAQDKEGVMERLRKYGYM